MGRHSKQTEVGAGTLYAQASGVSFQGKTYTPYDGDLYKLIEGVVYPQYLFHAYDESYRTNPYTRGFVDYLYRHILGSGWHVEGPGANEVEDFFKKDQTVRKLNSGILFSGCLYGNSYMDFRTQGFNGPLSSTKLLKPHDIAVKFEHDKEGYFNYEKREYTQGGRQLRDSHLFHFLLNPAPFEPLSEAPLRPTLLFLTMLHDSNGDIGMAIKRAAYAPYLAKLDLEGLDPKDKKQAIEAFAKEMEEVQSARTNWVIDQKHDMGFIGALGGGAGALSMPTNDLLEPVFAISMMAFGIPLGMFLQTGANKAILREQIEDSIIFYNNIRSRFRNEIEELVFPRISDKEVELVWDMPSLSGYEMKETVARLTELINAGIITADQAYEYINFESLSGKERDISRLAGQVVSGNRPYEDIPEPREVDRE